MTSERFFESDCKAFWNKIIDLAVRSVMAVLE